MVQAIEKGAPPPIRLVTFSPNEEIAANVVRGKEPLAQPTQLDLLAAYHRAAQGVDGCQQAFQTSLRFGALFTEHEAPQLVAQLLHFFGSTRLAKAFRQIEKGFLLFLARMDSLLDELHQDPVIAEAPLL